MTWIDSLVISGAAAMILKIADWMDVIRGNARPSRLDRWLSEWITTLRVAPPFSRRRRDLLAVMHDTDLEAWHELGFLSPLEPDSYLDDGTADDFGGGNLTTCPDCPHRRPEETR